MEFNTENVRAVATGFKAMFMKGLGAAAPFYKDFVLEIESTGARETITIPEGIGELAEWIGPRQIDTPIRWVETIENKDWQKTLGVPVNAYKDDQLGIYKAQAEMLGVAAATHPDSLLAQAIFAGFTNTGYDNKAFFASDHPIDGGTQSNVETGALSSTTYRSALAKLQSMKDYFGKPLRIGSMGAKIVLMVGPGNRATGATIVSAPTLASGASNPDYQSAELVVNEYFTGDYANYWCLLVKAAPVRPFILQMREKPSLVTISDPTSEEVFKNKRVLHGVQGRWNLGYGFYQLAVGSTGS